MPILVSTPDVIVDAPSPVSTNRSAPQSASPAATESAVGTRSDTTRSPDGSCDAGCQACKDACDDVYDEAVKADLEKPGTAFIIDLPPLVMMKCRRNCMDNSTSVCRSAVPPAILSPNTEEAHDPSHAHRPCLPRCGWC